jgi:tetratricopeptide (TPR) repeat protein
MNKRLHPVRLAALAAFVAAAAIAAPASADDASDAKSHYQKATAHYAVGEYKEAAAEYEAAYKAKQDPALLYNAAQSHRLAGENQRALLLYKNIVKLHPTSKYATESKDRIEKLEQAISSTTSPPNQPAPLEAAPPPAAAPPPTVQPLAPPAPTATPVPAAAPPPSTSAPAVTITSTTPSDTEQAPFYTKWWFWTAAGVVVVGAAVGIALAASSTKPWNNVSNVMGSVR